MNINKNTTIWIVILAVVLILVGFEVVKNHGNGIVESTLTPTANIITSSPEISPSQSPVSTSDAGNPMPSVSSQVGATVPWNLLPKTAACSLKGTIEYLNVNTYDNKDALFTYSGVDHPARNIHWAVTPEDDLKVGPNIFARLPIPNGQSLIGLELPASPKYKKYELYAIIDYGRLVDAKGNTVTAGGNVKLYQAQCIGRTTVVLP